MSVDFSLDYFALFGLPRRFRLDGETLDRAWHTLQSEVHPDQHAHLSSGGMCGAIAGSSRVNEAYVALKKPVTRARYLLELAGIKQDAIDAKAPAPEYLIEQLEWREAVEEARQVRDIDALEQLALRQQIQADGIIARLAEQLDDRHDLEAAVDAVQQLMFFDKLRLGIDNALAAFDN
ncbi:MAG: Fe-S protein assembly co-chaperone HscB [Azoarcus sp.]|jgi:molecular chaperone HscB|nr:Fe-S protein assembly co-chaperone HscB [Azoarcus sp.]